MSERVRLAVESAMDALRHLEGSELDDALEEIERRMIALAEGRGRLLYLAAKTTSPGADLLADAIVERDRLREVLRRVVGAFHERAHPGYEARKAMVPLTEISEWTKLAYPAAAALGVVGVTDASPTGQTGVTGMGWEWSPPKHCGASKCQNVVCQCACELCR